MKKKRWEIVYEDDDLIVIDKPANFLSIPDRFDKSIPSLVGLLSKNRDKVLVNHRLDKETSGLIVFSKTDETHKALSIAFENREIKKHYLAIVSGIPPLEIGMIDLAIGKSHSAKRGMKIDPLGKPSQTKYRILTSWRRHALLELKLYTGRQHQIRVHLKALGCPVVSDSKYGDGLAFYLSSIKRKMNKSDDKEEKPLLSRVALHSHILGFIHPITKVKLEFTSELTKDLKAVVNQLSKWSSI